MISGSSPFGDMVTGETFERKAHAWLMRRVLGSRHFTIRAWKHHLRAIFGSSRALILLFPRVHDQPQAYILQNEDSRIVFVIPYLDRFSIIGTTDVEYQGDPREVAIDENEINYLLNAYNNHFVDKLQREDVVWTYSGVRPLCDDESDSPQAITRDYTLELEQEGNHPAVTVDFRRQADDIS